MVHNAPITHTQWNIGKSLLCLPLKISKPGQLFAGLLFLKLLFWLRVEKRTKSMHGTRFEIFLGGYGYVTT